MRVIFVGGVGRSGTTLLGSLLGGAKYCVVTPESQFKWEIYQKYVARAVPTQTEVMDAIYNHWRFKLWGIEKPLLDCPFEYVDSEKAYATLLLKCVKAYADRHARLGSNVWIDHTPDNIAFFPLLSRLFPDAAFVHIVRDGRGVAASLKSVDWGPSTVVEAADWWQSRLAPGLALELGKTQSVYRVHFEDLVLRGEATLRKLAFDLNLTFSAQMLTGDGFKPPAYTRGQHSLVGGAPKASQADAWKAVLSPRDVELFESRAGSTLHALGYDLMYKGNTTQVGKIEGWGIRIVGFLMFRFIKYPRYLWRRFMSLNSKIFSL